ncbi:MAG TPA: hypothetical protein P5096_00115 [Patescibacteria group bacterium]|nr:hypothetical protein [Patescibacteria group bacterium]
MSQEEIKKWGKGKIIAVSGAGLFALMIILGLLVNIDFLAVPLFGLPVYITGLLVWWLWSRKGFSKKKKTVINAVAILPVFAVIFFLNFLIFNNIASSLNKPSLVQQNKDELDYDAVNMAAEAFEKLAAEEKAYEATPEGQKCKSAHPDWTKKICEDVAKQNVWIGMTYEMLVASAGREPDSAKPSNYGSGTQWQWCYHGKTTMCFYDNDGDKKIDAYN